MRSSSKCQTGFHYTPVAARTSPGPRACSPATPANRPVAAGPPSSCRTSAPSARPGVRAADTGRNGQLDSRRLAGRSTLDRGRAGCRNPDRVQPRAPRPLRRVVVGLLGPSTGTRSSWTRGTRCSPTSACSRPRTVPSRGRRQDHNQHECEEQGLLVQGDDGRGQAWSPTPVSVMRPTHAVAATSGTIPRTTVTRLRTVKASRDGRFVQAADHDDHDRRQASRSGMPCSRAQETGPGCRAPSRRRSPPRATSPRHRACRRRPALSNYR